VSACPDCSGVATAGTLSHDETCPLGRGIEQMCARDRAFFASHPLADAYWRSPSWAEVADLRAMDPTLRDYIGGKVRVARMPGLGTARDFSALAWLAEGPRSA
jgi:hypothetical protein